MASRLSKFLVDVAHSIHEVESVSVLRCALATIGGSLHSDYISYHTSPLLVKCLFVDVVPNTRTNPHDRAGTVQQVATP